MYPSCAIDFNLHRYNEEAHAEAVALVEEHKENRVANPEDIHPAEAHTRPLSAQRKRFLWDRGLRGV